MLRIVPNTDNYFRHQFLYKCMIVPIIVGFVVLVLLVGFVGYVVSMYNQLVSLNKECERTWSNISVLLQQRSDELPKLIDTAQEYMDYEQETLQQVIDARSQVQGASNPKQQAEADEQLKSALGNFFALAEDYPELKANENFQNLQERISSIEEQISDRRELYNQAVTNYNTLINQIPYVFLANQMNLQRRELYRASDEAREDIDISDAFSQGQDEKQESRDKNLEKSTEKQR